MIRLFSNKSLIASAITLGALMAGSAAHARTDVTLVLDLNSPHRYAQPAPVFVQHQQIPLQARTVYMQPQNLQFGHDRDRFDRFDRRGGAQGDADRDGIPNKFDRDSRFYDARATQRHAQWRDFDGDGVVNQFDRAPRNPRRH
jgi:thrombospondin type 3 repeat protein